LGAAGAEERVARDLRARVGHGRAGLPRGRSDFTAVGGRARTPSAPRTSRLVARWRGRWRCSCVLNPCPEVTGYLARGDDGASPSTLVADSRW